MKRLRLLSRATVANHALFRIQVSSHTRTCGERETLRSMLSQGVSRAPQWRKRDGLQRRNYWPWQLRISLLVETVQAKLEQCYLESVLPSAPPIQLKDSAFKFACLSNIQYFLVYNFSILLLFDIKS